MALQACGLDSSMGEVWLRINPPASLLKATILNPAVLRLNITSMVHGFVVLCDRQANKCCKGKRSQILRK